MIENERDTTKREQELFVLLKQARLRREEKEQMKHFLTKELRLQKSSFVESLHGMWRASYTKPAFGLGIFVLMALVGVGVGKASEEALPGEMLYVAKTELYEPAEELFSEEDVLKISKECIKRRLDEAEILSMKGKLGEVEKAQIEALIEKELVMLETHGNEGIRETLLSDLGSRSKYFSLILDSERRMRIIVFPEQMETENQQRGISHQEEREEKQDAEDESDDKKESRPFLNVRGGESEDESGEKWDTREHEEKDEEHKGSQGMKSKTEEKKGRSNQSNSEVEADDEDEEDEDVDEEEEEEDDDHSGSSGSSGSGQGKN